MVWSPEINEKIAALDKKGKDLLKSIELLRKSKSVQLPGLCEDVLLDMRLELAKQYEKWGHVDHPLSLWVTIIAEELGEVSTEVLNFTNSVQGQQRLYKEAIQVAVAAIAMAEQVKRSM